MAKKKRSLRTIKSLETQIKRETARQEEQAKEMMSEVDNDVNDTKTTSMNTELAGKIRKSFMKNSHKCTLDKFTEKLLLKYPTLKEGPVKSALRNKTYKDYKDYDDFLELYNFDNIKLSQTTETIVLEPEVLLYKIQNWRVNPFHHTLPRQYSSYYLRTVYWHSFSNWFKKSYQKQCQQCGKTTNLCVHHKNYSSHFFGTEYENIGWLETLCKGCHKRTHDGWKNATGPLLHWKKDSMYNYVTPKNPFESTIFDL